MQFQLFHTTSFKLSYLVEHVTLYHLQLPTATLSQQYDEYQVQHIVVS
jgi:hypothetical protein